MEVKIIINTLGILPSSTVPETAIVKREHSGETGKAASHHLQALSETNEDFQASFGLQQ